MNKIENTILIHASPATVWQFLTHPAMMRKWMGDEEMGISVITDWKVGSPILIKGFHHTSFENRGSVLVFKAPETLSYTHLSSLSRLPDDMENHAVLTFQLKQTDQYTQLTLQLENFATESIYRHLNFYWNGTLGRLKHCIETSLSA